MPAKKSPEINNLLIALVLSTLILFGWQHFYEAPRKQAQALALKAKAQTELQVAEEPASAPKTRAELLTESPRLRIKSDSLHGSIDLKGLRFDDLTLARYRETLSPTSPEVVLFSPAGDVDGYFAQIGWLGQDTNHPLPGPDSVWSASAKELTPAHPVTLSWKNAKGDNFNVVVALDEKYMFTLNASAKDASGTPLSLQNYAYINRIYDIKMHPVLGILHEGPLGVFDGTLKETTYKKMIDEKEQITEATSGWLGITDKYWLSAIIPSNSAFTAHFNYYESKGKGHFQTDYASQPQTQTTLRLFAGAKELSVLDAYGAEYNIPLFDRAVDFGMFYFLTKPIFLTLQFFHTLVGNFGIAILILTVIVKLCMFPLASKSFKAMNQMKTLQPKMKEIQERNKEDKVKMNQEIMELYKREKINPAAGCLPLFVQIPVFFSLYKVLYVTIEMRHAPFFGWIHDLSAPDPTNLFTLFGLLHVQLPAFLHLGIWPIIFAATMVLQQHMSPPPPDPMQAKMMKLLPFVFLFMFSSFPAGLVIYWSWSNTLTILQQWYINRTHGPQKAAFPDI